MNKKNKKLCIDYQEVFIEDILDEIKNMSDENKYDYMKAKAENIVSLWDGKNLGYQNFLNKFLETKNINEAENLGIKFRELQNLNGVLVDAYKDYKNNTNEEESNNESTGQ